ncbi:hypothetical protein DV702_08585 [Sporosarcina sp. PTS2304]|uniref:hypothetical protein n=1 Tax=Sporosarcina sp. PTS2304 TaxID=2283194 RepID=UPI000E0DEECF|nr:hypothetical protein [Sporosarcina sp. PTS2304]AXH99783.1 hypothetical protein DV702_08585 [Sporosarcina sp. PTS2304]
MTNREIIIEIDKVTSGKKNVISFERKGNQIDRAPLKLKKQSVSSKYKYSHHFDKDDLQKIHQVFPSIYPHPYDYEIEAWGERMKKAFRELIETGQFDKTYDLEDGPVTVKYVWVTK